MCASENVHMRFECVRTACICCCDIVFPLKIHKITWNDRCGECDHFSHFAMTFGWNDAYDKVKNSLRKIFMIFQNSLTKLSKFNWIGCHSFHFYLLWCFKVDDILVKIFLIFGKNDFFFSKIFTKISLSSLHHFQWLKRKMFMLPNAKRPKFVRLPLV